MKKINQTKFFAETRHVAVGYQDYDRLQKEIEEKIEEQKGFRHSRICALTFLILRSVSENTELEKFLKKEFTESKGYLAKFLATTVIGHSFSDLDAVAHDTLDLSWMGIKPTEENTKIFMETIEKINPYVEKYMIFTTKVYGIGHVTITVELF